MLRGVSFPSLYVSMCANPHLQYSQVVGMVRFLGVDPLAEEYIKFLLRCCTARIVLVAKSSPYITTQREDDNIKVGKKVVAQA